MEIATKNLQETADFAKDFLTKIKSKQTEATILALKGDLGSGKTTFTQFVAKELGIRDNVTSPTFVIEKRYVCAKDKMFKQLIHLDCYRLNSSAELLRLDWSEIIKDSQNLIIVEWPERIADILPKNYLEIEFEFVDETERKINIEI